MSDVEALHSEPFYLKDSHIFKNYQQTLNKLSQEIRDYEAFLKENHVNLEFGINIEKEAIAGTSPNPTQYSIHWGPINEKKEYRLFYREITTHIDWEHLKSSEEAIEKPLIEASLWLRSILRDWLPHFHNEFKGFLLSFERNDEDEQPIFIDDEIPF